MTPPLPHTASAGIRVGILTCGDLGLDGAALPVIATDVAPLSSDRARSSCQVGRSVEARG
jgi:hypothetical protein